MNFFFAVITISAHHCSYPGCNSTLVLDGNMKNRRDVCAATEAGYVQYDDLPGAIKTGCQLSPLQTSKFCYYHAPRTCKELHCDPEKEVGSLASICEEGIVKCIVAKKITRSNTYYQVISLLGVYTAESGPETEVDPGGGGRGCTSFYFLHTCLGSAHATAGTMHMPSTPATV